jgi:hypothetical protein
MRIAPFRVHVAVEGAKERGLAGAVAADNAHARAVGDRDGGMVEEELSGDAEGDVFKRTIMRAFSQVRKARASNAGRKTGIAVTESRFSTRPLEYDTIYHYSSDSVIDWDGEGHAACPGTAIARHRKVR